MDNCYICGSDRDPHLMMICDLCDYVVAHTYCCGYREFPEDWVCTECNELLESDDSDLESEDDLDEQLEAIVSRMMNQQRNRHTGVRQQPLVQPPVVSGRS